MLEDWQINNIRLKNVVFLLIMAIIVYGLAAYLNYGIRTAPFMAPIELVEGHEMVGEFKAKWDVSYEIHLDTERKISPLEQNCLLGIEIAAPDTCIDTPTQLFLSWTVASDDEVIASGNSENSQEGYHGPTTGKILGSLPAKGGADYNVTVTVRQSAPDLIKTNPHLKIEVQPKDLKWTYVWIGLSVQIATFCLLLAIVLAAIGLSRRAVK